ncbi:MAG TPA: pimeloyl-ACP methyl ester esterase BioH [Steroidobacteraceae bacterium]|nr:pimeloyl-ACP methyl ester esterase BioH [Steroidobacteraceae bacterium]
MNIHVDIHGDGPDLVLLHGWAMHGGIFTGLLPALVQRYTVHLIDLPGHGRSAAGDHVTTLEQMTGCIQPHIPGNAIVLGWSLGGQIALQLAARMSLHALILVSATPKFVASDNWPQGMAPQVFSQFFARLHDNLQGTVQDFLALQVRGDLHAAATLKALRERLLQFPPQAQTLESSLAMLRDTDLRNVLPLVKMPALLIAGEHDRITHPRATQFMANVIPHARYVEIRKAGHASFISHRDEFLHAVNEFLDGLDRRDVA